MAWIWIGAVVLLLGVMLLVWEFKIKYDWDVAGASVGTMLVIVGFVILLTAIIFLSYEIDRQILLFEEQKAYVENYEQQSDYDLAAVVDTKVELNTWLFDAQNKKELLGNLSFYPEKIFDLEPIE